MGTNLTTVVNDALARSGSYVSISPGSYSDNGGIITPKSNDALIGGGYGNTVIKMVNGGVASGTRQMLLANTLRNFTLQGIAFNENGQNQGGSDEVKVTDCANCLIMQNNFYNPYDSPLVASGSYYPPINGSGYFPLINSVPQRFNTYSYNIINGTNQKVATDLVDSGGSMYDSWIGNTFYLTGNTPALSIASNVGGLYQGNKIYATGFGSCFTSEGNMETQFVNNICEGVSAGKPDFVDIRTFTDLGNKINNYGVSFDHNTLINVYNTLYMYATSNSKTFNYGIDFSYNLIINATGGARPINVNGFTMSWNIIQKANPTSLAYTSLGGSQIVLGNGAPSNISNVIIADNTLQITKSTTTYLVYGFQWDATGVQVFGNQVQNATGLTGNTAYINQNDTLYGNTGYNPLGSLTNAFHTTSAYISDGGADTASPANATTYTVGGSPKEICIVIGGAWTSAHTLVIKVDGNTLITTTAPTTASLYCTPTLTSGQTYYAQYQTSQATFYVSGQ